LVVCEVEPAVGKSSREFPTNPTPDVPLNCGRTIHSECLLQVILLLFFLPIERDFAEAALKMCRFSTQLTRQFDAFGIRQRHN
jgi:hypothetical protein